jgi:U3 small nucleolar RNA-associated protein 13
MPVSLQTLEGHDASVLRLEFVSAGLQILTTGGDGLVKLWNLKSSDCVTTLDAHNGRIWALAGNL